MSECNHETINALDDFWAYACPSCGRTVSGPTYVTMLREQVTTLKAQREWVSVEERLPELETEVLVWNTHHESMYTDSWCELSECPVIFSTHSVATGVGWRDNDPEDISHWLPIPAAPEGE